MDSFKDSIDTTLATKAEEVATAASQSADLIKKCKEPSIVYPFVFFSILLITDLVDNSKWVYLFAVKDDLLESFGCLRKDLKENEELKEVISKVTPDE